MSDQTPQPMIKKEATRFQKKFPDVEDWGLISYQEAFEKQKILWII